MAIKINEITGCRLHAGTIRRWLSAAGLVWRRAAPALRIRDPNKEEKMAAISASLAQCSQEHPVFYEDEVNIHINPKIVADWQFRGQQKRSSRRVRMKNIIWQELFTVAPEKSVTWVEAVKVQCYLSAC